MAIYSTRQLFDPAKVTDFRIKDTELDRQWAESMRDISKDLGTALHEKGEEWRRKGMYASVAEIEQRIKEIDEEIAALEQEKANAKTDEETVSLDAVTPKLELNESNRYPKIFKPEVNIPEPMIFGA